MPETFVPETDAEKIARLRAKGWGPTRILSGLGYPGFGVAFSRRAIDKIERYGLTAGEAVYGGVDAQRKIFLATEAGR